MIYINPDYPIEPSVLIGLSPKHGTIYKIMPCQLPHPHPNPPLEGANLCTHLCRPLILLPSPTCGRGAGGEGEAKNNVYSFKAFPLPNPLPQAGEGTCVHRLALKGREFVAIGLKLVPLGPRADKSVPTESLLMDRMISAIAKQTNRK